MAAVKYKLIADQIRSRILKNDYKVGESIPTELQLQKDYGVSRYTVREAVSLLVNEGYLKKEKGSGTYVTEKYLQGSQKGNLLIGFITTHLSDYIFPAIISGIEKEMSQYGYSLLLASSNGTHEGELKCLEMMMSQGIAGLIVNPTNSSRYNPNLANYLFFKEKNIPLVMINAHYEELETPYIEVDDVHAGYLATNHLIENGHSEIILVSKVDEMQGKHRMKGFVKAYEKNNLIFQPDNIITFETQTKDEQVEKVIAKISDNKNSATAIYCYNDELAKEIIQKLNEIGKCVPEDISVIGQDDSRISLIGERKLTTITHPKDEMGKRAAQWVISAIEEGKIGDNTIYVPELVQRETVKSLL